MADIRGIYDARLHQRFMAEQYFNCMVSLLEEISDASTRYFIASNNCTRKNCVRFWVKGFKVKVDQNNKKKVFILSEQEV